MPLYRVAIAASAKKETAILANHAVRSAARQLDRIPGSDAISVPSSRIAERADDMRRPLVDLLEGQ
jgi:hypothetical protein